MLKGNEIKNKYIMTYIIYISNFNHNIKWLVFSWTFLIYLTKNGFWAFTVTSVSLLIHSSSGQSDNGIQTAVKLNIFNVMDEYFWWN